MTRRFTFALTALVLSAAVSNLSAQRGGFGGQPQTPAYPDPPAALVSHRRPVIKRIWAIGMDSSHVKQLSQVLFDSLGPRLMGAPNTKARAGLAGEDLRSWGIPAKHEQYGTWRGWERGHSHIDLITPRVRTLEGTMVGYSPGTGGKNVDAEPIVLPQFADSNEFVQWLPQAKGKLVMVSATKESCRPNSRLARERVSAGDRAQGQRIQRASRRLQRWYAAGTRGTGYSSRSAAAR